jgi:hypothetical protein
LVGGGSVGNKQWNKDCEVSSMNHSLNLIHF